MFVCRIIKDKLTAALVITSIAFTCVMKTVNMSIVGGGDDRMTSSDYTFCFVNVEVD